MGSRVAQRLAGRPLRLIVRDAARAPAVAAEVREAASYGSGDEMRAALDGVDTLFLIPAKESADASSSTSPPWMPPWTQGWNESSTCPSSAAATRRSRSAAST